MYLDRLTRSIRPPQTDRTCKDRVWDKRRTFHESNLIHKLKNCMVNNNVYFGRDVGIDVKFDV